MLRNQIDQALKDAMKAGDKRRVSTLRMMNAGIKDRDIAARGEGKGPLSDEDLLALFQKMIKQRQESLELYQKAARADLVAQESEEIAIISSYLPKQMSDHEMGEVIGALLKELGAQSVKDMGKVMAAVKARFTGKMDMSKASGVVKSRLLP